ncbi:8-amino-7-oxononanoate synthase [Sciscionella marina]|uniref:8-amino-7-oxononanoate synthase n=1 Tax=Sciscionella marina TaxID=508770 RepID=UPI00037AB499|nr:8-amino-7-oxononanoate synthase [Sciscionella marina]
MFDPESAFAWLDEQAGKRAEAGLTRRIRPRPPVSGLIDLAGADYLGLARNKRVTSAAAAAALKWGAGTTGSRLVTGSTELHAELERELAAYAGTEAALVFSSGFTANLGAVTALSGKECAIVADKYMHASLIDACRQSGSAVAVSGHADVPAVTKALATRKVTRALVLTESVFTVDGGIAPLAELHAACREHGAGLVADIAHGFGILGDGGLAEAGLAKAPDVVATVSLATALGSQGGAVLGPRRVIAHLVNTARTFLHDTGLNPPAAGAALTALKIAREEPERAARALEHAATLGEGLRAADLQVSAPGSAVVSVLAPSPQAATDWANAVRERGVAIDCSRPPSAPDGVSRLRLRAHAELSAEDVELAVRSLTETAPRS